jgi:cation transport ATPase
MPKRWKKMNEVDTLIIDKTGTLTEGRPSLEKVISLNGSLAEAELIRYIISVNQTSEHPLAAATLEYGKNTISNPGPAPSLKRSPAKE